MTEPRCYAGVDIDTKSVAFAVINDDEELVYSNSHVFEDKEAKKLSLDERIRHLVDYLEDCAHYYRFNTCLPYIRWCGLEQPIGHIHSAVMVALATGAAATAIRTMLGSNYQFFYPQVGKHEVTGKGRPTKAEVYEAARERWGEWVDNDHVAHAIGMALAMKKAIHDGS